MKKTIAVIALIAAPALASAQAGLSNPVPRAAAGAARPGMWSDERRWPLRPADASGDRHLRQEVQFREQRCCATGSDEHRVRPERQRASGQDRHVVFQLVDARVG